MSMNHHREFFTDQNKANDRVRELKANNEMSVKLSIGDEKFTVTWTTVDPSYHYPLRDIRNMPTLKSGQFDNLKVNDPTTRVWLSRRTIEDGAEYNNAVTVGHLINGVWTTVDEYQAI